MFQSRTERSYLIYRLSSLIDVIRCLVTFVVYLRTFQQSIDAHTGIPPYADWKWQRIVQEERDCNRSKTTAGHLLVSPRSQAEIACCGDRYDPQLVKCSSESVNVSESYEVSCLVFAPQWYRPTVLCLKRYKKLSCLRQTAQCSVSIITSAKAEAIWSVLFVIILSLCEQDYCKSNAISLKLCYDWA